MINFDTEKKGYNKEQVAQYFERVQAEYEEMYAENQALLLQLQEARQASDIPPDRMQAIALALVDAETEAQRIIAAAQEQARQILADAASGSCSAEPLRGQPAKKEPPPMPPPERPHPPDAVPEPTHPEDIDELIDSIRHQAPSGGDG